MKSFLQINSVSAYFLCVVLMAELCWAQVYDLTGVWKDENDVTYCIRQVGNEVYWYMDDMPRVRNVFYGIMSTDYVTGKWADLPGGELMDNGTLTLEIVSNDSFVKINQSTDYWGSVWIRTDTSDCTCASTDGGDSSGPGEPNGPGDPNNPTGPEPTYECPCGLGWKWEVSYQIGNYWLAMLTRRGNSNVFDVFARTAAASGEGVLTVTSMIGNRVDMRGADTAGNNSSIWTATIGEEVECQDDDNNHCCSVSGTWYYDNNPSVVYDFSGRIYCNQPGSSTGGGSTGGSTSGATLLPGSNLPLCGRFTPIQTIPPATLPEPDLPSVAAICDNPRTLPIMDYWLARAKPLQEPTEDLCFEEWGRVVGISNTAILETSGPPATSLSRCEWLWEHMADAVISEETLLVMGTFQEFVWDNIWLE